MPSIPNFGPWKPFSHSSGKDRSIILTLPEEEILPMTVVRSIEISCEKLVIGYPICRM